jgi:hypothetical protein
MRITYRVDNPSRDFKPGDVTFTIPGIGNANREGLIMASDISATDKETLGEITESEGWAYEWDEANDVYIFTNLFSVSAGTSTSGAFEMMYTMDTRDLENGYTQTDSPYFTLYQNGSYTNSITLQPMTFNFTSARDLYRIQWTECLSGEEYGTLDDTYMWKKYKTTFDKTWNSRGLYKSSYYVDIDLPDDVDFTTDDIIVMDTSGEAYPLTKTTNDSGETVYRFYVFEDQYGDIGSYTYSKPYTFYIGVNKK